MARSGKPAPKEDDEETWRDFEIMTRLYNANARQRGKKRKDALTLQIDEAWKQLTAEFKADVIAAIRKFDEFQELISTAEEEVDRTRSYPDPKAAKGDADLDADADLAPIFEMHLKASERQLELQSQMRAALRALDALQKRSPDESDEDPRRGVQAMLAKVDTNAQKLSKEIGTRKKQLPQHQKAAAARAERRCDGGRLGKGWVGAWPLGKGAAGHAGLFLTQSVDGSIIDRIVIKDSDFQRTDWWDRPEFWVPDPKDSTKNIPAEIYVMARLSGRTGSENIVKIRNWRIETAKMSHRIYMEFCPHGDLHTVMETYPAEQVPLEPFVWHCLESLAIAGLVMERGGLEKNPVLPWDLIIHRDLKLDNIFLGAPSRTKYRQYPVAKLGDFGHAISLTEDDERDWIQFGGAGPWDYMAPEQVFLVDGDRPEGYAYRPEYEFEAQRQPLTTETNVYAVGITIWCLMQLESGNRHIEEYSPQLRELVLACTSFESDERPAFSQVLKTIHRYTGPSRTEDLAEGLRDAPYDDEAWAGNIFNYQHDSFEPFSNIHDIELNDFEDWPRELPRPPFKARTGSDSDRDSDSDNGSDDLGGPPGAELNVLKRKRSEPSAAEMRKQMLKTPIEKKPGTAKKPKPKGK